MRDTDFNWGGRAPLAPTLATALVKRFYFMICLYLAWKLQPQAYHTSDIDKHHKNWRYNEQIL